MNFKFKSSHVSVIQTAQFLPSLKFTAKGSKSLERGYRVAQCPAMINKAL